MPRHSLMRKGRRADVLQKITSAETSLNQLPAALRLIESGLHIPSLYWARNGDVLDYGGGRFEKLTEALANRCVRNWVLDPFNRSPEHNEFVTKMLRARPAAAAICSNVLNVVREPAARRKMLREIKALTAEMGRCYFTVYEGDRSSRGRRTTKGWQANRPTKNYARELKREFEHVQVWGKLLICER